MTPRISERERHQRECGDAFAVGNIGLEDVKVSEEHEAIFRRYVSGEIDLDELDMLVDAAAQALVSDRACRCAATSESAALEDGVDARCLARN